MLAGMETMLTWTNVIVIAGTFAALGPLMDRFMLKRQKGRIYDFLLHWWDKLDDTHIPELHKCMANWTIQNARSIVGDHWLSIRGIIITVLISFSITIMSLSIGYSISVGDSIMHPLFWRHLLIENILQIFFHPLYSLSILIVNMMYDIATVVFTFYALRLILSRGWLASLAIIIVDFLFAVFFCYMCAVTANAGSKFFSTTAAYPDMNSSFYFGSTWRILYGAYFEGRTSDLEVVFYASTTFIPTAIYMGLLLLMFLGKFILKVGKCSALFFLERMLDDSPTSLSVFTLTGSLFSVILLIAKTMIHFLQ